jgi:hypothetical protein
LIVPSPLIPGRKHPGVTAMAAMSKVVILFMIEFEGVCNVLAQRQQAQLGAKKGWTRFERSIPKAHD